MRTGPPRVSQLAERRSAWLGDDLTAITLVASLIDQAERFLPELIASARLNGHTWNDIAPGPRHQPRRRPPALRPGLAAADSPTVPCHVSRPVAS